MNHSHIGRARLLSSRRGPNHTRLAAAKSKRRDAAATSAPLLQRRSQWAVCRTEAPGEPRTVRTTPILGTRTSRPQAVRTASAQQVIPCLTPERHGWDAAVSPTFLSAGPDPVLTHAGSYDGPVGLKTCTTSHGHRPQRDGVLSLGLDDGSVHFQFPPTNPR